MIRSCRARSGDRFAGRLGGVMVGASLTDGEVNENLGFGELLEGRFGDEEVEEMVEGVRG